MQSPSSPSLLYFSLILMMVCSPSVRCQFGLWSKYPKTFVVPPSYLNAIDIITPISFRVATNLKPHLPETRIPHTDVIGWSKYWTGTAKNPQVWRRILYGPGKDPYTGYFIY